MASHAEANRSGRARAVRLGLALLVAAALGTGGLACDDDDPGQDVAQPRTEAPEFGSGAFDALPRLPGSSELTPATEERGVLAQSFLVEMETPERVMTYYEEQLAEQGWAQAGEVEQLGESTFRGDWRRERLLLTVSSSEAPAIDDEVATEPVSTQYSLQLTEAETAEDLPE